MSKKTLHPSVQQFKEFVKKHPQIVLEVRRGNSKWQDLFEEWYLLGEEDSRWDEFKERNTTASQPDEEGKKEWMQQVMGAMKNMDTNQLQHHVSSLSQALGAIQGLILQFQGNPQSKSSGGNRTSQPQHPFQFRKD
ncbi:YlbD family protein [Robertmurraya kyonggiensis]|uniref:Coat protein n=1 Tax=Robertmurraya kyonggiensis TaxID=1037680 RepID=A0A4U1D7X7_9BACI|nr:YlbD family protein [Robertmurraya kyonggiensis]TKC18544.1 hypothetical protein FA727_03035 [Robertmurraya kyonggiensis]